MSVFHVYSRQGCHLCEQLIEDLLPIVLGHLPVEVHDVDSREDWCRQYDTRVPVLEFDEQLVCEYQLDRHAVEKILARLRQVDQKSA